MKNTLLLLLVLMFIILFAAPISAQEQTTIDQTQLSQKKAGGVMSLEDRIERLEGAMERKVESGKPIRTLWCWEKPMKVLLWRVIVLAATW